MNIAICLGSLLLARALQEQLQREAGISGVLVQDSGCDATAMKPDFLITDVYTVNQKKPDSFSNARTILLDYGLGEETIAGLLIGSKIDGIMSIDTDMKLLLKAFRAISNGQIWIDNSNIKALMNFADNTKDPAIAGNLSNKEREIVVCISRGCTNKEIASELCISEQTVKSHINSIFKKMNVSRRTQLVPLGMKLQEYADA